MPKLKTHKGAKRRFHVTGSGKIMQAKGGKSHFRRRKAGRTRGLFDEMHPVSESNVRMLKKMLPYSVK